MTPGTDLSPQLMKEECCSGLGVSAIEDQNVDYSQTNTSKPPRNLSTMRHCSSSAFLSDSVS